MSKQYDYINVPDKHAVVVKDKKFLAMISHEVPIENREELCNLICIYMEEADEETN